MWVVLYIILPLKPNSLNSLSAISFTKLFSLLLERDLFGAEPFDPFNCGAGDFPPDIQSKLDEMQVTVLRDWLINGLFLFNMRHRECYILKVPFP